MAADFTPTLDGYTGQSKLRFWCQKVLPLVYDDSLSYYELLNKIVVYLNNTIEDVSACEDNIVALRDAFVELQDYVNEVVTDLDTEIEQVIDEMIDSGEFGEILANVVNGLIAKEYDPTEPYLQFAYCLKDGKLYCATASTTGEWDATKWRETTVGNDMQLLSRRLYNLNAGQIEYNSEDTYNNGTVGKELQELNSSLNTLGDLFGGLSFKGFSMGAGKTATLTFASKSNHAFIFTSGVYIEARSIVVVSTNASGIAADPSVLAGGAGITATKDANTVSITNGTNAILVLGYMCIGGEIPTITTN